MKEETLEIQLKQVDQQLKEVLPRNLWRNFRTVFLLDALSGGRITHHHLLTISQSIADPRSVPLCVSVQTFLHRHFHLHNFPLGVSYELL